MIKINETPVRTSRNFNINNIKLENINIPEKLEPFNNLEIIGEITINENIDNTELTYGIGSELTNQIKNNSNKKIKMTINKKTKEPITLNFKLDKNNINLVENIEIILEENTKSNITIKYETEEIENAYHNGIIKIIAKNNAKSNITIVNLLNETTNNFISIENTLLENSKINYCIVDFGGKNSITNYYSNLEGKQSENKINTIYLGKENQLFDLNYIGQLKGEKTNIDIEVQGALKDTAKKHFKGTIDFKKGSKKAKGNENEFCMLLSETARSIALPMLLCSEEDVEGNHSSAAGKVDDKQLFYIMSRGFTQKDAMKLIVKAKFNKILETIKDEKLKETILQEIDKRLD